MHLYFVTVLQIYYLMALSCDLGSDGCEMGRELWYEIT